MSDQSDSNVIINKTLQVLIQRNDLNAEEIAQLRLSHLHLAGKNPSISFTPEGYQEPKVVALDMETHRALVGWLVNRPDSTSDFLFPGSGDAPMEPEEIRKGAAQAEALSAAPEPVSEPPKPTMPPEADMPEPAKPQAASASRPVRPLSRPEIGAPPPGAPGVAPSFVPPPTAPEEDETVTIPPPTSRPTPPVSSPPLSRPMSTPRPPSGPMGRPEPEPSRSAPPPATPSPAAVSDSDATLVGAKKPELTAKEAAAKAGAPTAKPPEKTAEAPAKKETKIEPPLAAKKPAKPTLQEPLSKQPGLSRAFMPGIIGIVLLCAVCMAGAWFVGQSEWGSAMLASWGLSGGEEVTVVLPEETSETVVFESALPTATLPPTATSTLLPVTDTPTPEDTATPTNTPTPLETDTPTPTETPEPTDTPEEEEVPSAPLPSATPGLKYAAVQLLEPRDGFAFIRGNTLVLRWSPVDLASDEQYAVRLIYTYQGQVTYQGANIKEPEWTVPLSLFGQVDGPENKYEWFVVVERLNDDGSGTAISPESEHRTYTWN